MECSKCRIDQDGKRTVYICGICMEDNLIVNEKGYPEKRKENKNAKDKNYFCR